MDNSERRKYLRKRRRKLAEGERLRKVEKRLEQLEKILAARDGQGQKLTLIERGNASMDPHGYQPL